LAWDDQMFRKAPAVDDKVSSAFLDFVEAFQKGANCLGNSICKIIITIS